MPRENGAARLKASLAPGGFEHGALLGIVILQGFWAVIDANELAWLPAETASREDSAARSVQSLRVGIAPPSDASPGVMLSLAAAF